MTDRETYVDRALRALGRGDLENARHWRRHVQQLDAANDEEEEA
jgi:hypothetical protein